MPAVLGTPLENRHLLEWMIDAHTRRPDGRVYSNPARLPEGRRKPRPLTAADIEFVCSFDGTSPASVPAEDIRLLAQLEAAAQDEISRRVVARVLGPIRRHHDRQEEEAELRNTVDRHSSTWRTSTVRDAWAPVLAERLAEEARAEIEPQLSGLDPVVREKALHGAASEAERSASTRVDEVLAALDREAAAKVKVAQRRLAALAGGAEPESSAVRTTSSSYEEGRRRGREEREARTEARTEASASFGTRVG